MSAIPKSLARITVFAYLTILIAHQALAQARAGSPASSQPGAVAPVSEHSKALTRAAASNPPGPPDLRLTGVAAFGARKWAFLIRENAGAPARVFSLQENDEVPGLMKLLGIDPEKGAVELLYQGVYHRVVISSQREPDPEPTFPEAGDFVAAHVMAHELRQQEEAAREESELGMSQSQWNDRSLGSVGSSPGVIPDP